MFKSLLAIVAAAVCAAAVVGFIPPPAPAVAAAPPVERGVTHTTKPTAVARVADVPSAGCKQAWPFYEQSCLHGSGAKNGGARIVRVIATGKPSVDGALRAQR